LSRVVHRILGVQLGDLDGVLRIVVRYDGAGGAGFARGTGLVGLKDGVEALGGRISLDGPHAAGTTLRAELPLTPCPSGSRS
jgi:signal transduction histidine kinase